MSKPMLYAIPLVLPGCSLFPTTDVECVQSGRCISLSETMPKDLAISESDLGAQDLASADGGAERWNPVFSTGSKLNAIHGVAIPSGTGIFVVGNAGTVISGSESATSFKIVPSAPSANNMNGVYSPALKEAYVVDDAGKVFSTINQGSSWNDKNVSAGSALNTVTGKGTVVITAGADLKEGYRSANMWTSFAHNLGEKMYASWTSAGYWYVAGDNGAMARTANPADTWTVLSGQNVRRDIRGLWGLNDNNIWAVSANGRISRFNGSDWMGQDKTSNALSGIWGSAANDIWAVGARGSVFHYDGDDWQPAGSTNMKNHDLTAVWGDGKGNIWAVGNGPLGGGTIFKY